MTLLGIAGCSDMPYTGSMLTVDDVDQYLVSIDGETFCLQNGHDSACLTLTPRKQGTNAPVIHIYPSKLIYIFYHKGKEIVRAEKVMDTTEIVEALTEQSGVEDDDDTPPPPPPPQSIPTTLERVSGNYQIGIINQRLMEPLVVRVRDQNGNVLSGITVNFSVNPTSGVLNPTSVTTGANGKASTELTLGHTTENYTVTATVSGIAQQVTFTATAINPPRLPPPPPPARIAATLEEVRGNGQSAEINQYLANPLVVRVLDQYGDVLSGVTVNFSVSPSSGVLNPSSATTGSNGEASTALQLGNTAGSYTVTASVSGIAQQVTFTATATNPPPRATTLEYRRGNGQSAEINQQLANSLVVRVLDQYGDVLSGVTVNFSVSPSGTLNPTSAATGSNGEASTALTLGNTARSYRVTASVSDIAQQVTFTATATNPPPQQPVQQQPPPQPIPTTLEQVSGNGQSAEINQPLANSLVVRVLDQHGAVLSGITVNFSVNPTSGVLSPASTTTGSNGEASTALTLGNTARSYTVTARVSGIAQQVTFTATATNPPAENPPVQQPPPPPPEVPKRNGWLVWIHYPANYIGPRSVFENGDYGFNIEDLSDGAEITSFAQTSLKCVDDRKEKPCHDDGNVYSAQFGFETSQEGITFRLVWKPNSDTTDYWKQGTQPAANLDIDVSTLNIGVGTPVDAFKLTQN